MLAANSVLPISTGSCSIVDPSNVSIVVKSSAVTQSTCYIYSTAARPLVAVPSFWLCASREGGCKVPRVHPAQRASRMPMCRCRRRLGRFSGCVASGGAVFNLQAQLRSPPALVDVRVPRQVDAMQCGTCAIIIGLAVRHNTYSTQVAS